MQLKYVDTKEEIIAINRKSKHIEPHLHNALEIVCVTSGALELGVGQELYHMEKGDIGFVFPDVIHHYQVLTPGVNKATYLIASPFTIAKFADIMQSMAPEYPIIKAEKVEPEVYRVINAILETEQSDITVAQAYLQIVLARCIGKLNLVEKSSVGSNDLIYQTVSYISANFKKKFSLEEMAKDLGVSKYVLSRLFSKIFHELSKIHTPVCVRDRHGLHAGRVKLFLFLFRFFTAFPGMLPRIRYDGPVRLCRLHDL